MTAATTLVVGIGNTDRGDDGIGPTVARAVHDLDPSIAVLVREGDLADLPLGWEGFDHVLIVDACSTGRPVGEVTVLEPHTLRRSTQVSTHGVGIAEVLALARNLGRMPPRLTLVGVEATVFGIGPMSAPLAAAVPTIAARLRDLLRRPCIDGRDRPSSAP